MMESHLVRIYRRNGGDVAGTFEALEPGTRTGFADGLDLLAILGRPSRVEELAASQPPAQAQAPGQER